MNVPRLHVITDDGTLADPRFVKRAAAVIEAGGARVAFHVRGHGTAAARLFEVATKLRDTASAAGSTLLVNDRVDVAICACADGVQLGRRSAPVAAVRRLRPAAIIGVSVHSVDEAAAAAADGADFVLSGAIRASASHPGAAPAGPALIRRTATSVRVPVIGIGGITPDSVGLVTGAGGSGVAVLSGIWSAASPEAAVAEYLRALDV